MRRHEDAALAACDQVLRGRVGIALHLVAFRRLLQLLAPLDPAKTVPDGGDKRAEHEKLGQAETEHDSIWRFAARAVKERCEAIRNPLFGFRTPASCSACRSRVARASS